LSATAPRRKKSSSWSEPIVWELESSGVSVSPALFEQFQQLIHEETGIWLGETKMALLCGRLSRRLRALGISDLDCYYELVMRPDQSEERVQMIDAITTNETRFFREPRHFEFLERKAIPRWQADAQKGLRSRSVRCWSAGCSSGEEPYSLAMLLATNLRPDQGWDASILATDISTRVIAQARLGIYGMAKSTDIPDSFLKGYMLKGSAEQEGHMKVMPDIQAMVEFQRLNLTRDPYPPAGRFDVIFCRNVLIYFNFQSRHRVIEQLTRCLSPAGLLFVGHAESLSGINSPLRSLAPAIYARAGESNGY